MRTISLNHGFNPLIEKRDSFWEDIEGNVYQLIRDGMTMLKLRKCNKFDDVMLGHIIKGFISKDGDSIHNISTFPIRKRIEVLTRVKTYDES